MNFESDIKKPSIINIALDGNLDAMTPELRNDLITVLDKILLKGARVKLNYTDLPIPGCL